MANDNSSPSTSTGTINQSRAPLFQSLLVILVVGILLLVVIRFVAEKGLMNGVLEHLSPFRIEEVKISSEWPLSVTEVRSWLPPIEGKNLFTVSPSTIIESLQKRPWIENVIVKKQYPNHLLLEVETKRPQAMTVMKGQPYFLDQKGQIIEKVRPQVLKALDLPFLSVTMDSTKWNIPDVLAMLEKFKKLVNKRFLVSQVVLGTYPYFKIFLDNPKVEVLLNLENWESQAGVLTSLLLSPPSQIGQLQRINLIFPKKAVVSSVNKN